MKPASPASTVLTGSNRRAGHREVIAAWVVAFAVVMALAVGSFVA